MMSAKTVRQGSVRATARIRGVTRKLTGSSPITTSASTSCETFIVPSSAAIAEPKRPATMIAVKSGASSRIIEIATRAGTSSSAPIASSW